MKRCVSLLLALAMLAALVGCGPKEGGKEPKVDGEHAPQVLAAASYPEMAPYPDEMAFVNKTTGEFDDEGFSQVYDAWRADKLARQSQPEGYADGLDGFFARSIRQLLSGAAGENRVYSPLNVYMALCMLAELTDGESRGQILKLLGAESVEALRTQAENVWNGSYCDDGAVTSVLAGSLWLNQSIGFVQETMDALAAHYHASAYRGEMGSPELNQALQDWLNQQTGGLLAEQVAGVETDPLTILALATTVYFRAKWDREFSESATAEAVFHAPEGDVTAEFMHQGGARNYYWSEKFSAVSQRLEGSGSMWLLLPDEGVSPEELLADEKTTDFILADGDWADSKYLVVNLSLPKFDAASDTDLIPGLKALGVTDVFDAKLADFSPMTTDTSEVSLSQAKHAARVKIDEEGVVAAAYTVMMAAGAAMPPEEEIDFTLDRPFLFAMTGADGLPLFVGVVNQPN